MRINNNLMAMNTYRQLKINSFGTEKSIEKLSSGYRINRAGDDAAGLAISEKMRAQIKGLQMSSKNAQDGISMIQTAEGALSESHSILQRMRELSVQAANDSNVSADRSALSLELVQLSNELNRIASTTQFNTRKLLNGSLQAAKFQVGANANETISLSISAMSASALGVVHGTNIGVATSASAQSAVSIINSAISSVSVARAKLGAVQNRLEHTINNLDTSAENLQAAEARIRDTDMAQEMMRFTKHNILNQAATAMMAQANQQPQTVLSLLT